VQKEKVMVELRKERDENKERLKRIHHLQDMRGQLADAHNDLLWSIGAYRNERAVDVKDGRENGIKIERGSERVYWKNFFLWYILAVNKHEESLEEKRTHLNRVNQAIAKLDASLLKLAEGKKKLTDEIERKVLSSWLSYFSLSLSPFLFI
jgi:hypothetical protein